MKAKGGKRGWEEGSVSFSSGPYAAGMPPVCFLFLLCVRSPRQQTRFDTSALANMISSGANLSTAAKHCVALHRSAPTVSGEALLFSRCKLQTGLLEGEWKPRTFCGQ